MAASGLIPVHALEDRRRGDPAALLSAGRGSHLKPTSPARPGGGGRHQLKQAPIFLVSLRIAA